MVALDSEYITGIPDLYSNQPRQFHVSVPCHKAVACTGPATIVFRVRLLICTFEVTSLLSFFIQMLKKESILFSVLMYILFQFNEMTPHSHWEQRIPQNRQEQAELLKSLSCPVSFDLCKAVARTEHVVGSVYQHY